MCVRACKREGGRVCVCGVYIGVCVRARLCACVRERDVC